MSGIAEAITVISCVAALICAYKDAGTIVQRIKQRRERRGGLPPTVHLEDELKKGELQIEAAARDGVERYGSVFEEGDDATIRALQAATIDVQRSMLTNLREALQDDSLDDFSTCMNSAFTARLKVVDALHKLSLRQFEILHAQKQTPSGDGLLTEPTPRHPAETVGGAKTRKGDPASPDTTRRRPSFLKNLLRSSNKTESGDKSSLVFGSESPERLTYNGGTNLRTDAPGQLPSSPELPHHTTRTPHGPGESSSSQSSTSNPRTKSFSSPVSTASKSKGFCGGASHLQAGFLKDGLKIYNQSIAKTGESYYWSCRNSRCVFEGRARRESGQWHLDDTIRDAYGIRFRWLFLAKSHVEQGKVKRGIRHYRCLICALRHPVELPLLLGESPLLEHLSQHSSEAINGVTLSGPVRFGKEMLESSDEVSFDVFFPIGYPETYSGSPTSTSILSKHTSSDHSLPWLEDPQRDWENVWTEESSRG